MKKTVKYTIFFLLSLTLVAVLAVGAVYVVGMRRPTADEMLEAVNEYRDNNNKKAVWLEKDPLLCESANSRAKEFATGNARKVSDVPAEEAGKYCPNCTEAKEVSIDFANSPFGYEKTIIVDTLADSPEAREVLLETDTNIGCVGMVETDKNIYVVLEMARKIN